MIPSVGGSSHPSRARSSIPSLPWISMASVRGDVDAEIFDEERALVDGASIRRVSEFVSARHCAHLALAQLGVPICPILSDSDGAPIWPLGLIGSITHCSGFRGALVGMYSPTLTAVGIDAELNVPLPPAVARRVFSGEETERMCSGAQLGESASGVVGFTLKEAAIKAAWRLLGYGVEFHHLLVHACACGSANVKVSPGGPRFNGIWILDDPFVVSIVWCGSAAGGNLNGVSKAQFLDRVVN